MKNRSVVWTALGLAILSMMMVLSPVTVSAAGPGVSEGYRRIDGLEFSALDDLLVSEAHNRVIIVGDDRLEFFSLDSLAPVAVVEGVAGILDPRVQGGSVFFAGSDGVITELQLLDGSLVQEWPTETANINSIAVDDDWIWFGFGLGSNDAGVARIARGSGATEVLGFSNSISGQPLVRISAGRPGEFFLGTQAASPASIVRYSLDGLSAVQESISLRESVLHDLEVSADGERVWSSHAGVRGFLEWYADSMGASAMSYDATSVLDSVVEASQSQLLATTSHDGENGTFLRVFDRGVPVARQVLPLSGYESELALTTSEVLVVTRTPSQTILQVWSIDYEPQPHTVEISVFGHGSTGIGLQSRQLRCAGGFSQHRQAELGETLVFELPAGVNSCFFLVRRDPRRPTLVGRRAGGTWTFDEYETVQFDARDGEDFVIVDYLDWPGEDFDELIRQMYKDLFDRQINFTELIQIEYEARQGGLRNDWSGFVLDVMDKPGAYERTHAPIARLYRAFFLRDPDVGGQAYWVGLANGGLTLALTAQYFEVSEEFSLRYGALDDREFVTLVYENVMGRVPDQGGYDYWLDQMSMGMTRGELMIYFSDSPEYRNKVSGRVFVVYAARVLEQRDPSEADIDRLLAAYQSGGRDAVVTAILDGDAYYQRFWVGSPPPFGAGPG